MSYTIINALIVTTEASYISTQIGADSLEDARARAMRWVDSRRNERHVTPESPVFFRPVGTNPPLPMTTHTVRECSATVTRKPTVSWKQTTMVPFDQSMWDAFNGAKSGADGTMPHTNATEVRVDGEDSMIIADNYGMVIYAANETDSDRCWSLKYPNNIHHMIFLARFFGTEIDSVLLVKLGFQRP